MRLGFFTVSTAAQSIGLFATRGGSSSPQHRGHASSATLAYTTLITLALVRSTRAMAALSGSQPKVLVFGYGSNGVAQLRARCSNPTLTLRPARLPDHARVFCLRSPRWGQGGVASLAPSIGQHCLGSVAAIRERGAARPVREAGVRDVE